MFFSSIRPFWAPSKSCLENFSFRSISSDSASSAGVRGCSFAALSAVDLVVGSVLDLLSEVSGSLVLGALVSVSLDLVGVTSSLIVESKVGGIMRVKFGAVDEEVEEVESDLVESECVLVSGAETVLGNTTGCSFSFLYTRLLLTKEILFM